MDKTLVVPFLTHTVVGCLLGLYIGIGVLQQSVAENFDEEKK